MVPFLEGQYNCCGLRFQKTIAVWLFARKFRASLHKHSLPAKVVSKNNMVMLSLEEEPIASSSTTTIPCYEVCKCTDDGGTKKEEKKRKCELIRYDELPEWLKDNEFIHGYYRCEWPMKETILSIFSIHNETLNVWS